MSLTEIAIKRPLLILVAFTAMIIFGVLSYTKLNYELLPKFDANVVTIITTYRGASAAEVENTVTKEIEEAVSTVEGIDRLTSQSMENASVVVIELKNGIDVNQTLSDVQRKVDLIRSTLPDDIDEPTINKFSTDETPILRIGVKANMTSAELYDLIDLQVKPQIANVEGVGQVSVLGGTEKQVKVELNTDKLEAIGLNSLMVTQIVANAGLSTPAGDVESASTKFSIQYDTKFQDVNTLANMVLTTFPDGSQIRLKDVASVELGVEKYENLSHVNGVPAISLSIVKQSDANAVAVSKGVRERIETLTKQFESKDLEFIIVSDQSIYTLASADAVVFDLFLAIVIVSITMLLFLHSVRSSLFILVALPASIIPTFIAMSLFGLSLNLLSLMALSLVVGILVDDSIVILENIYRHMEMGKDKVKATIEGRKEIGFTAVAITMVDVVVFVPLAVSGGIIGNILREFALVVVFSTLMSLLVCFTLTPLLAARFGKLIHLDPNTLWGKINIGFENFITRLRDAYTNILRTALRKKRWVYILVIVLMGTSVAFFKFGFIGTAFMTKADRGELIVKIELPNTANLTETNLIVQQAERIAMKYPEVKGVFSSVGFSSTAVVAGAGKPNQAEISLTLVDKNQRSRSDEVIGLEIQSEISNIPGVKATLVPIMITGNAAETDISLALKSGDRETLMEAAAKVKEVFEKTAGTKFVEYSIDDPKPLINIQLDYDKLADYGISAYEVGYTLATTFRGSDESKFKYGGNEYSIMINADPNDKRSIEDVKALTFSTSDGASYRLDQFAMVEEIMGESVLERMDRLPSIKINSAVVGRAPGTVASEIMKSLDKLDLPSEVSYEYVGQIERQEESFGSLILALGIAILLVYLVMVALYENAIYPLVVLTALPLATIGAFLALALTMENITIFAMIGIIMLMGLVAKNGILLVDFSNEAREKGMPLVEALIEAGKERFRPILMTTLAMVFGMLPIALASGSGAEVKNGMAWVIIGGLTSSLILTLVVVPCTYYIVAKLEFKFNKKKRDEEEHALATYDAEEFKKNHYIA